MIRLVQSGGFRGVWGICELLRWENPLNSSLVSMHYFYDITMICPTPFEKCKHGKCILIQSLNK